MAVSQGLLGVLVLIACAGCSRASSWESHATFTVRNTAPSAHAPGADLAGTYTAADPTVPAGYSGHADVDPNGGSSPGVMLFDVMIGEYPGEQAPNLYYFSLELPNYHGRGWYRLVSGESGASFEAAVVSRFSQWGNGWSTDRSNVAACLIEVTADAVTKDPVVRQLKGRITCHGLYDNNWLTSTAELSGQFDVFAQVYCAYGQPVHACRTPPP
jgi:hypothetical protein